MGSLNISSHLENGKLLVRGRNPREYGQVRQASRPAMEHSRPEQRTLMEEVVGQENMLAAFERVRANKGAPGVDGMRAKDVWGHYTLNESRIKEDLLEGRYQPQPMLGVEVPCGP